MGMLERRLSVPGFIGRERSVTGSEP
jgi:hypothetical protein